MHYLLFYEFVPDYLERRATCRDQHLKAAWESQQRKELLLAGAFENPVDGAALVFQCESPEIPERFARSDPYLAAGLITRWWVRKWSTVVGDTASAPVRPAS